MIVNVIMLKLKERTDENVFAIQKKLLEMKGNIEQLREIRTEVNIQSGTTAFDMVIITKYDSMQRFNEYVSHPLHMNVGKHIQDACEQIASVCYEE